eukprot:gene1981-3000_t
MDYTTYTGSSYDLYPNNLKHYRFTLYNGDVDACVPWNSNEDWVISLTAAQGYRKVSEWHPWKLDGITAGYAEVYQVSPSANLSFVTIKDSGHMVPEYQPERAYAFFRRWIDGKDF